MNDDGLYIKARPSDVGNITYQTKSEVDAILKDLGYEDGDDIPWGLINPFRAAGMIYTRGEGVKVDLGDAPDLDPNKLENLSESEAEELLSYLESRDDVPQRVLEKLREKIESGSTGNADAFRRALDIELEAGFDFTLYYKTEDYEEINRIEVECEQGRVKHELDLYSNGRPPDVKSVDEWTIHHEFENNWDGLAKAFESKPKVIRAIGLAEDDFSFEIVYPELSAGSVMF
ncbi:hypothetical protein PNQ29_08440 [Halobacterium salinarum]|uniref:hypothetical protein n=1 Tax=Halobacterium salinarum TaxID=2242 RepID=UPI0025566517|nr:hypothetical protein [Halobacterium salinarum]MDL0118278.1 hypothetical protein [Halobacterium salinarum]MDL0119757.1 hypothetical protein [Halobacterium salinarum]